MVAQLHDGLVVASTGEHLPAIDHREVEIAQFGERLTAMRSVVTDMGTIDELEQADAWLTAIAKRLKQLGEDAAEAERIRILLYIRGGELLDDPKPGNPSGANQYTQPGGTSDASDVPPGKSQAERNRDWHWRTFKAHKTFVVSIMDEMKKPSIRGILREIKRITAKLGTPPEGGEARITLSRWEDWLPHQPSCDLLLTDPPYATDVDDIGAFAAHWLPFALGKVKPTGRAYVCIGAYPHEVAAYLTVPPPAHLILSQVLVWTYRNTLGPTPKHDYKLNWQAILYYRGVDAPPLDSPEMVEQFSVADINAPDGRQGDRWHAWQKPDALAERFVRHATNPGDLVLDPFAGTGTHLLAAARLGRRGYGCDMNPETFEIARQRGCIDAV